MEDTDTRNRRLENALALSTVATYLVIILGATVAVTKLGSACSTWPTCNGYWIPPFDNLEITVAWGYRLLVAVTGLGVLATTVLAWLSDVSTKVKAALLVALLLYPVEMALGAVVATVPSSLHSAMHLAVAMVIFSALLVALTWALEREDDSVGDDSDDMREKVSQKSDTDTPIPEPEPQPPEGIRATLSAYLELMKPRLMWLLCLVALAAMGMASATSGAQLDAVTVVATLLGGVLSIGASGTFNNVIERDRDRKMERTSDRPVAQNEVPVRNALVFGSVLSLASIAVFAYFVNFLAAALGLIAILFYSVVYTVVLKPHTTQNTVLGGAVGALPALIGWAAVTNTVGIPAIVLGGVIFVWTPAHFYNLALAYKDDYAAGDFPMLPVVRGEAVTRRHILLYLGATLVSAGVLGAVANVGWVYAVGTTAVGAVFVWAVVRLYRERSDAAAMRAFHASNAFLGTLLVAVVIDTLLL
ncbi:MAG: heme o synthase [Halobacteria archaeon]|nr:heme o synthase [Halobacteria archaeon]